MSIDRKHTRLVYDIFKRDLIPESIGNDKLLRNHVYLIHPYEEILKIYGDVRRWEREIASLNFMKSKGLEVPQLIDFGIGKEEDHWLLMEKIDGVRMADLLDQMTLRGIMELYEAMGIWHSKFHNICATDIFGDWNYRGEVIFPWDSYASFAMEKNRKQAQKVISKGFPDTTLFEKAYEKMLSLEHTVTGFLTFSICHNDLNIRNVLINKCDEKFKIVGIIDFEASYPSDPESDMAKTLLDLYSADPKENYMRGYMQNRKLSPNFEEKALYYKLAFSLEICSWSFEKDQDYYVKTRDSLVHIISS